MGLSILSDEENAIRDAVRTLVDKTIKKNSAQFDQTAQFPRENLRLLGEQGYLGMVVEEEWGGAGATYLAQTLVVEAIASVDPATAVSTVYHGVPVYFESRENRDRFEAAPGDFPITPAMSRLHRHGGC